MSTSNSVAEKIYQDAALWQIPDFNGRKAVEEEVEVAPITAEEIEAIQQQAYQEGFAQGEQDGLASADQKLAVQQQQLVQTVAQLQQIVAALQQPFAEIDEMLAQQVCDVAVAIAERVLQKELQQQRDHLPALVRDALTRLPSQEGSKVAIYLHPQDLPLVEQHIDSDKVQLHSDESLQPGGCRLESNNARIDASVEQQIRAVVDDMFAVE